MNEKLSVGDAMVWYGAELRHGRRRLTRDIHGYFTVEIALTDRTFYTLRRHKKPPQFRAGTNVIYNGRHEHEALNFLIWGNAEGKAK